MDELELEIESFRSLLSHKGCIFGCVKQISKINFEEDIIEEYKEYLLNSKTVVVEFVVNQEASLFELNYFMSRIHEFCHDDTHLIFGAIANKKNMDSQVVIKMLISGVNTIK